MTLQLTAQVQGYGGNTAQQAFQTALALGDLLDLYRPNLERRFMLDLLEACLVTTEDVLELGLALLRDAGGLPEVGALARNLQGLLGTLACVPVSPLAA